MVASKSRMRVYMSILIICLALTGCVEMRWCLSGRNQLCYHLANSASATQSATAYQSDASPTAVPTTVPTEAPIPNVSLAGSWVGGFQLPGGDIKEQRIMLNFTESASGTEGMHRTSH